MFELTVDNALDYLRGLGRLDPGPARVEALMGGVSNQVLRVETPDGLIVLKQSRPQLRTRDAWFSDLERIEREQEVMQALGPLLPSGTVPNVLFTDRPNFVYAMSHAPLDARVWKTDLLAGVLDDSLGERVGRVLGRMHQATADNVESFRRFSDHAVYVQLRVDPFYRRVQERRPEVAVEVGRLIDSMLSLKEALCHGDYTPKNILTHADGFMLVDYETAHLGDPTMDLGLFLAHLTLKAFRQAARWDEHRRLMAAFWDGYARAAHFRPLAELERRGVAHLGVCLLARVDGTSPVEYLHDETKRDAIRRIARTILQRGLERWDDIWEMCGTTIRCFAEDTRS